MNRFLCRSAMAGAIALSVAAPLPLRAATADPAGQPVPAGATLPQGARGSMRGPINVMVELTGTPAAQVYAQKTNGGASTQQLAAAAAKSQVATLEAAQGPIVAQASALGATILYRTQRVYNGIAMRIDASQVPQLRRMPGVKAVRVMVPKEMDNSSSVPFIGAPAAWIKGLGYRGEGIKVGVIDTGIDYLHTNNGGPGTGYGANNTTVVGDVPNYPGAKVAGGYDFAGDAYTGSNTPVPDGDPMDCNGHGSHVAGTVGGYGVNANGTTFAGPWGDGSPFASMRIGPGVAPQATLYALRVFGCTGSTDLVTQALEWATDPNGDADFSDHLDVVNMSLGSSFGGPEDDSAVAAENAAAAGVVVVASAGNSGDTYFITGSPAVSARTISVASSKDAQITADALEVIAPPAIAGLKTAFEAAFGPDLAVIGDRIGDLQITSPTNGCAALTGFTAGKIALIDRGACTFVSKVKNAQNAGAIAVVMVNNVAGVPFVMGGSDPTITIPSVMVGQADGTAIKAQIALAATVTVRMSASLRGLSKIADTPDTVSSFTSRGPSRGGALKPDLSSIGDTVYSTKALSGVYGVSFNGTSMSAPHVAGSMALLKQIHPTWSVSELKALIMNSANHNVFLTGTSPVVGPGRVGAGREDVANAVTANVVAYVNDGTGRITAGFGSLDVTALGSWTKTVTVANKGGSSATFNLAYVSQATTAGVTVTTSVPSITVAGGSSGTFDVTLTADPVAMKHNRDASVSSAQSTPFGTFSREWVTEEAGYVSLTPTGTGATLRVPVHAMPRPASVMGTTSTGFNISGGTGTANVTLSGTGVNTGPTYPTDVISLVSAFELAEASPENVPGPGNDDSADLKYVGVMNAGTNLEFGIASYGDWSTSQPDDTEFDVYLDLDQNSVDDWFVFNWNLGGAGGAGAVDVMYTVACPLPSGGCSVLNRLNLISPAIRDTVFYNTNVMIVGFTKSFLGITGPFSYYVASFNRENGFVDISNPHTFNPAAPGLAATNLTSPYTNTSFWTDLNGQVIPVDYNSTNFTANGSQGLLLLHHHNASGNRAQVLSVSTTPPSLSIADAQIVEGNSGTSNLDFTVTLSEPAPVSTTVDYTTNDGTATQPGDYTTTAGTLTFAVGESLKTISVPVVGDRVPEPNETFVVDLSNAIGATIADNQAVGTITNDDVAAGDVNGDQKSDIVWRDQGSSGSVAIWYMNGALRTGVASVTPTLSSLSWQIQGVGDFNADGKPDFVWRDQGGSGNVAIWLMNGATRIGSSILVTAPSFPGLTWRIAGTGDFNSDGQTDLVWREQGGSGNVAVWMMNGTTKVGPSVLVTAPAFPTLNWEISGVGDFNSDGKPDLVWYDKGASGTVAVWFMNGTTKVGPSTLLTTPGYPGTNWQIQAVGDYNGDGNPDLIWRDQVSTGNNAVWFMNGTTRTSSVPLSNSVPFLNWRIVGPK